MGYESPIGGVTRRLDTFTWIHSAKFRVMDRSPIGARMAVIQIPDSNKLVIWSSIPVSEQFDKVLDQVTQGKPEAFKVVAVIVPNIVHTMAAAGLKKRYPQVVLIGPNGIKDQTNFKLDYEFQKEDSSKLIPGTSILPDLTNLDFIYLNGHRNHEVITYDKITKRVYGADFLFNVPWSGINEDQYPGEIQTAGWRFGLGVANPDWLIGRVLMRFFFPKTEENQRAMKIMLNDLDFDCFICTHGNIFDKEPKKVLKKVFGSYV